MLLCEAPSIHSCQPGLRRFRHPPESAARLLEEIGAKQILYLHAVELLGSNSVVKKIPLSSVYVSSIVEENLHLTTPLSSRSERSQFFNHRQGFGSSVNGGHVNRCPSVVILSIDIGTGLQKSLSKNL